MNFEVFDAKEIEQYKAEVKSKWGNSKAYQEYEQRAVSDSEHNYLKFANEIMSLFTELGAMKQLPPTDKAVQEKVVALLLPAGSRGNDFLWIFRSAFFASFVHSY